MTSAWASGRRRSDASSSSRSLWAIASPWGVVEVGSACGRSPSRSLVCVWGRAATCREESIALFLHSLHRPGTEAARDRSIGGPAAPDRQESFLDRFLGATVVAADGAGDAKGTFPVAVVQLREGVGVVGLGTDHQSLVGLLVDSERRSHG
jgi:hypothetical protein